MKFEKYPKLADHIQHYASFGKFDNWSGFLEELNNALPESPDSDGWIGVEDGLPEHEEYVLAYSKVKGFNPTKIMITEYHEKYGFTSAPAVTHWRKLPFPPNK